MKHKIEPQQLSALRFERVWVREASFVDAQGEQDSLSGNQLDGVEIQLDVKARYDESGERAYVTLRAVLEPPAGKAPFVKLIAEVEGLFALQKGVDKSALGTFATVQAPVLLVPYLRGVVSSLTAQSRLGSVILPPLNMVEILKAIQADAAPKPSQEMVAR